MYAELVLSALSVLLRVDEGGGELIRIALELLEQLV